MILYLVFKSALISHHFGGYSVTFHAGFYLGRTKEDTYNKIKNALTYVVSELQKRDIFIYIRPELTGKATQFGDLDEIIKLSKEIDMVLPCIDFSHYNARSIGKNNNFRAYEEIFIKIKQELGVEALKNMHCHMAGIYYTDKGERNHLNLKQSDMQYKQVIQLMKKYEITGTLISESPNLETDALLLKETYDVQ
jgi:deoxyribonuclease-4